MAVVGSRQRRVVVATLLSTLGTTGVLIAQGSTQLMAAAFLPLDVSFGPTDLGYVGAAQRREVDSSEILRRNIFDHTTGRLDMAEAPPPVDQEEEITGPIVIDPEHPPPACEGSMRLVGAFVWTQRPEDSFAAITDASGQSLLYQQGMTIEDREVYLIQRDLVILRPRSASPCSLAMFADRMATAPPPPRVAAGPGPGGPGGESPEGLDPGQLQSGITQISEREFSIDRSLVNSLLANQAAMMRTARVIPHEENGRTVGVKLYGIRRSSLLGHLGIQNGDMLRTINGYDMTSPDSALEAYARLQSADRITIQLNRRGSDMTVDYTIR